MDEEQRLKGRRNLTVAAIGLVAGLLLCWACADLVREDEELPATLTAGFDRAEPL